MVLPVQSIHVLESSARRFRIEEIYDRTERGVEDDPDDVELPTHRLDPDRCDLNDHIIKGYRN